MTQLFVLLDDSVTLLSRRAGTDVPDPVRVRHTSVAK